MKPKVGDIWYRFDTDLTNIAFTFPGEKKRKRIERNIALIRCKVVKLTPSGCWVQPHWGRANLGPTGNKAKYQKHFVLAGRGKRWAYPDMKQAAQSYMLRKRKQLGYLADNFSKTKLAWEESLQLYYKTQGIKDEQETSRHIGEFRYTQIYQRSERQEDGPYSCRGGKCTSHGRQIPTSKNTHRLFEAYQQRDQYPVQYPSSLLRAMAGWRFKDITFE